jgi:hypothetical protein
MTGLRRFEKLFRFLALRFIDGENALSCAEPGF